jgi:transglutaminase-like putative cysteine protease
MNALANRALAIGFLTLLGVAASLHAAPGDVQASCPVPCKYPAGLATDGTHLYLADWRTAQIHKMTLNGEIQQSWDAPALKPHGLTWHHGRLYISDDHSGQIYVFNTSEGIVETTFEAPSSRPTGLAYADDALFLLERRSGKVYKVMPEDGTILANFAAPNRTCTCLAYDGKYLWASDRIKDEIYLVDPEQGTVLGIFDAPGPYPAGLACLNGYLWNVDFQSRKLYQITVKDTQKYYLSDNREARVEYLWTLYNYGPGDVKNLTVSFAVPEALPNQQLLSEIKYASPPTRIMKDRWNQACAVFELGRVPAGTRQPLGYHVDVKVSAIRYLIFPEEVGALDDIPAAIRRAYTADGSRYGVETAYIRDTARRIVGDEQNAYWIARKIFDFVIDKLEYQMVGGWDVPEVVLKRGSGSCSEYTFAFIALCRAAGLPARYQGSIVVRGDDASIDESFHRWAEIYLPNYGWVPVDANKGDAKSPADQARGFGELSNRFLITTRGGGGSEYLGWSYNSFAQYQATGYCKVEQENFGFWEPREPSDQAPADDAACKEQRPN